MLDRSFGVETDCLAGHIELPKSVREPPNWICVTISPEVGVSPAAETLRVRAALCGFAAPAKIQQAILAHEQVALELGSSRTRLRLDAAIGPARPRRATLMVRTLRDARLDTREARPRFRYPSQPSTGRGQTRRHQPANRR